MRLFIAIPVPDNVKEHFLFLQKNVTAEAKINFVKEFHLTLKFLGEISEENLEKIKSQLSQIEFEPFTAKLNSTGVFPSEKMIRVLWIGIDPADKIIKLQKKIEASLEGEPDKRFHPHITLARVKFVKDKKALLEQVQAMPVEPIEFPVDSVHLIKSTLTKQGPVYEVLASIPAKPL